MDPVTIATAVTKTAELAWSVGSQLYELVQGAKVVNETIKNLSSEAKQLGNVCNQVRVQLSALNKHYERSSRLRSAQEKKQDAQLGQLIEAQLAECNRSLGKLRNAIPSGAQDGSNFFSKSYRQIRLNVSKEEIAESRTQIQAHSGYLQHCLLLVNVKATYLAPKLANQELLNKLEEIQTKISGSDQRIDRALVQSARDVMASGATLYEESVAAGSIVQDPARPESSDRTLVWLDHLSSLRLDGPTTSPTASSSEPSIFSAADDTQTVFTEATSTEAGVPLYSRGFMKGDNSHDSVDNDEDDGDQNREDNDEDEFALAMANAVIENGYEAFEIEDYQTADSDLQQALAMVKKLSIQHRKTCDLSGIHYRLAVCAFHIHDASTAEKALVSVLNQPSRSQTDGLNLCQAGHLLSQLYIKMGKLGPARSSCEQTYHGRCRLLGKDDRACHESLALLSRIYELEDNKALARASFRMIPSDVRDSVYAIFRELQNSPPLLDVVQISKQILEGHSNEVNSVAFSPDCRLIASGADDETIGLWDVAEGTEVYRLRGHSELIWAVAFSPNGMLIVSGSKDKTIRLWEVAAGVEVMRLHGHSDGIYSVAFSPNGMLIVSGSRDKTIRLWDVATGMELKRLNGHSDFVRKVAFSPDGRLIVSGSGDLTIRLWDVAEGTEVKRLRGHSDPVLDVAFSPDGRLIVSGSKDKMIRLWDVAEGTEVKRLTSHSDQVYGVAFSPNGMLIASGSWDETIRLWNVAAGVEVKRLGGHSGFVRSIAFSPNGMLIVSGSSDNTIRLWDVAAGVEVKRLHGHSDFVRSIAFSPGGSLIASGSSDNTIRLWNVAEGTGKGKQV